MTKEILERIEALFREKLQQKTSWGRNDVLIIYKEAQAAALMEFVNKPVPSFEPRYPYDNTR